MNFTFEGGRLVSNFETLGAVATKSFTVPTGKRWKVLGFLYAERDANATLDLTLLHGATEIQILITQIAAGVTNINVPFSIAADGPSLETWKILKGMILDATWAVKVDWGAAQVTPEVSFPVLEIDI